MNRLPKHNRTATKIFSMSCASVTHCAVGNTKCKILYCTFTVYLLLFWFCFVLLRLEKVLLTVCVKKVYLKVWLWFQVCPQYHKVLFLLLKFLTAHELGRLSKISIFPNFTTYIQRWRTWHQAGHREQLWTNQHSSPSTSTLSLMWTTLWIQLLYSESNADMFSRPMLVPCVPKNKESN